MRGIESLIENKPAESEKMVAVKLPSSVVRQMQAIRKETGKTNSEVYTALLQEGLDKYQAAKSKNGKRRGRPAKAAKTPAKGKSTKK